jgi:hypothetical protein
VIPTIPTTTFALGALTLMLWLMWSDSVRPRRPHAVVYIVRALLFLTAVGVLLYNVFAYPRTYTNSGRVLVAFVAVVGIVGAIFFVRKALTPASYRPPPKGDDELRLKL